MEEEEVVAGVLVDEEVVLDAEPEEGPLLSREGNEVDFTKFLEVE